MRWKLFTINEQLFVLNVLIWSYNYIVTNVGIYVIAFVTAPDFPPEKKILTPVSGLLMECHSFLCYFSGSYWHSIVFHWGLQISVDVRAIFARLDYYVRWRSHKTIQSPPCRQRSIKITRRFQDAGVRGAGRTNEKAVEWSIGGDIGVECGNLLPLRRHHVRSWFFRFFFFPISHMNFPSIDSISTRSQSEGA